MIRNALNKSNLLFRPNTRFLSNKINLEKLEQESTQIDVMEEDVAEKEAEIERKRNKSRLSDQHYRMLHEQNPYPEPKLWTHGTLRYQRRTFGRYGTESGVDPALCWPTKQELFDTLEYEKVAFPYTVQQAVDDAKRKRKEKEDKTMQRQREVVERMAKLEDVKRDMLNRIAKRENEAKAAKERKERLIEEVRRHFGYTVDPRDDRFKEMLEKKEKEQKKAMKEARKKAKEEQMVEKLLKKKTDDKSEAKDSQNS